MEVNTYLSQGLSGKQGNLSTPSIRSLQEGGSSSEQGGPEQGYSTFVRVREQGPARAQDSERSVGCGFESSPLLKCLVEHPVQALLAQLCVGLGWGVGLAGLGEGKSGWR